MELQNQVLLPWHDLRPPRCWASDAHGPGRRGGRLPVCSGQSHLSTLPEGLCPQLPTFPQADALLPWVLAPGTKQLSHGTPCSKQHPGVQPALGGQRLPLGQLPGAGGSDKATILLDEVVLQSRCWKMYHELNHTKEKKCRWHCRIPPSHLGSNTPQQWGCCLLQSTVPGEPCSPCIPFPITLQEPPSHGPMCPHQCHHQF